jgi:hypothetical protein
LGNCTHFEKAKWKTIKPTPTPPRKQARIHKRAFPRQTVTSNSFKPFVARLQQGTNGVFHLSITPKEFEDSQK